MPSPQHSLSPSGSGLKPSSPAQQRAEVLTRPSDSSRGPGGEGKANPQLVRKLHLLQESLRTDAKEAGHSLCLGHLLTTDLILSWKELFTYSKHFRPLYYQLRQNSWLNTAWGMDVWHCVAIASPIFAKRLLIYYPGIRHLPRLLLPIDYYEEQCSRTQKSFNPLYKYSPSWAAHGKYLQNHYTSYSEIATQHLPVCLPAISPGRCVPKVMLMEGKFCRYEMGCWHLVSTVFTPWSEQLSPART